MADSLIDEPQMYKIYINAVEVLLKPSQHIDIQDITVPGTHIVAYDGIKTHIIEHLQFIEKSQSAFRYIIHHTDFPKLKNDFKSHFREIKAAGGLVKNETNQFLFIHRRGSWDLPKGKIEKNETKRAACLREVGEETGINRMEIIERICVTRHTYRSSVGRRLIKKTYWYLVTAPKQTLIPQAKEDIDMATWMALSTFLNRHRKVYPNILDVIHTQNLKGLNSKLEVHIK